MEVAKHRCELNNSVAHPARDNRSAIIYTQNHRNAQRNSRTAISGSVDPYKAGRGDF
jgi:hypothetical protein